MRLERLKVRLKKADFLVAENGELCFEDISPIISAIELMAEKEDIIHIGRVKAESDNGATRLKDLLINVTLSRSRAVPDDVRRINLGEIGLEAEEILTESLKDPRGVETGKDIYVTPDRRLLIYGSMRMGETERRQKVDLGTGIVDNGRSLRVGFSIGVNRALAVLPRDLAPRRQDRYLVTMLHSHGPEDLPPSADDFVQLFFEEPNIISASLAFVVSAERKILVFRGAKSPNWVEQQALDQLQVWHSEVAREIKRRLQSMRPYSGTERLRVNIEVQDSWLKGMAIKHDLRIFACPSWENVAEYQDPNSGTFLRVAGP